MNNRHIDYGTFLKDFPLKHWAKTRMNGNM